MKPNRIFFTCTLCFLGTGCMMTSTHEEILKKERDTAMKTQAALNKEREQEKKACADKAAAELDLRKKNEAELVAKTMQLDKLLDEKGALTEERQAISAEQKALAQRLQDLERMRVTTERRNAEYRALLEKLRKAIDAGTLQVKVRNGRMLVQMSSDVVFPSAGVQIKAEAAEAIKQLAETIKGFPGRRFQVIGHSDPTPITTQRFPSNWELSTQRAVEVVKLMVATGVPANMVSAAGAAEFDPLTGNDTPEDRATNRRVEIVFEPQIDEMPSFDALK